MADVAAGLVPPGWPETIARAAARRATVEGPEAVRPVATWDADRAEWRGTDRGDEPGRRD
jgi:hypothetical protein